MPWHELYVQTTSTSVAAQNAQALTLAVTYGQSINIRNRYGNGSYLDVRGAGCERNALCVSTSTSRNRDSGSGFWKMVSPSGRQGVVHCNDLVHLENGYWYNGRATYLDVNTAGCEGNSLCVSTAFSQARDGRSGTWKVVCDSQRPNHIYLQNQYNQTYLDVRGAGCEGNVYCVSTSNSQARDGRSGLWEVVSN